MECNTGEMMISIDSWAVLNVNVMFLLTLLLIFRNQSTRLNMGIVYSKILICTLALVICDTLARLGESSSYAMPNLVVLGNVSMFLLDPLDIMYSIDYVDCWMDDKDLKRRHVFVRVLQAVVVINSALILFDLLFHKGWFFLIEGAHYSRGRYFMLRAIAMGFLMILVMHYAHTFRNNIMPEYRYKVFVLPVFAMFGAFLQVICKANTTYSGIAMACLILYFYYQSNDINMDYLTGVLNRRGIDIKLEDKAKDAEINGKKFSAIMMDIDHFKMINDNLGHGAGDVAIQTMAEILTIVFGKESYIGRLGGDEFCVVSDILDPSEINNKLNDARKILDKAKKKYGWDDSVGISCGYEVYDPKSGCDIRDFMGKLDEKMYREKEEHHAKNADEWLCDFMSI